MVHYQKYLEAIDLGDINSTNRNIRLVSIISNILKEIFCEHLKRNVNEKHVVIIRKQDDFCKNNLHN